MGLVCRASCLSMIILPSDFQLLKPVRQPKPHDFTFFKTYSNRLFVHDIIRLSNRYGLQSTTPQGLVVPQTRLHIDPESLVEYSPVLGGLKNKKIADLVYQARFQMPPSALPPKPPLPTIENLLLTFLFEHKLIAGPDGIWQLFDYTSALRQAKCPSIIPILTVQDGAIPSSVLPDAGREMVGLGPIIFPCFVLFLPDISDEVLLDPDLTSGGILFTMKRYKDIKALNAAGQKAVRQVMRYFYSLPNEHQVILFDIAWQYLYSLNSSLDEETMSEVEQEVMREQGEKVSLIHKYKTWSETAVAEATAKATAKAAAEAAKAAAEAAEASKIAMQQGRQEELRAVVRRMLQVRIDRAQIRKVSGLNDDEIEKIRQNS